MEDVPRHCNLSRVNRNRPTMFLSAITDYNLSKLGKRVERLIKRIKRKSLLK